MAEDEGEANRLEMVSFGYALEGITLFWNVLGVVILAIAAIAARSVALGGFGLDSLIEIGASVVVLLDLSGKRAVVQSLQRRW